VVVLLVAVLLVLLPRLLPLLLPLLLLLLLPLLLTAARCPQNATLIDNGFYMSPKGAELAGEDAWSHTSNSYAESMSSIGGGGGARGKLSVQLQHLQWIARSAAAHPSRTIIGHGNVNSSGGGGHGGDLLFRFGLAKYMLVAAGTKAGWFLANDGSYSIDGT